MRQLGKLRSWNDDRGFGFIAPTGGGPELFVHISAFPRDGSRPTVGESVSYELGRGKDGKPQALRVLRQALGDPASYPAHRSSRRPHRRSPVTSAIGFLLVVAMGAFGYDAYRRQMEPAVPARSDVAPASEEIRAPRSSQYSCDGRTTCSQMRSCAEATFFLRNCPGTQMDGNNDGVPCERQWCTGLLAE
jgi:cold shock CspA family protein